MIKKTFFFNANLAEKQKKDAEERHLFKRINSVFILEL